MNSRNIRKRNKSTGRFFSSDFSFGPIIGKGATCKVFRGTYKRTGLDVALKVIDFNTYKFPPHYLIDEINLQRELRHDNILQIYGYFFIESKYQLVIVMEYIEGGELYEMIKRKGMGEKTTSKIVHQVLLALQYLRQKHIVHRDIKPENILVNKGNIKLIDFGFAAKLTCTGDKRTTTCGTLNYFSPEIIRQTGYDYSVDLWTVGILTHEMLIGFTPFRAKRGVNMLLGAKRERKTTKVIFKKIMEDNVLFPEYRVFVSDEAKDFIRRLLVKNVNQRITLEVAMKHPFITKYN